MSQDSNIYAEIHSAGGWNAAISPFADSASHSSPQGMIDVIDVMTTEPRGSSDDASLRGVLPGVYHEPAGMAALRLSWVASHLVPMWAEANYGQTEVPAAAVWRASAGQSSSERTGTFLTKAAMLQQLQAGIDILYCLACVYSSSLCKEIGRSPGAGM